MAGRDPWQGPSEATPSIHPERLQVGRRALLQAPNTHPSHHPPAQQLHYLSGCIQRLSLTTWAVAEPAHPGVKEETRSTTGCSVCKCLTRRGKASCYGVKPNSFVTDEDPRGRNVSLQYPLAIYMIAQQCPNLVTHHHSHEEMGSYACTTHSCIHTRQTENRQTHVALKDPQKPFLSSAVRHVSASSASKHSRKGSMTHVRTYTLTRAYHACTHAWVCIALTAATPPMGPRTPCRQWERGIVTACVERQALSTAVCGLWCARAHSLQLAAAVRSWSVSPSAVQHHRPAPAEEETAAIGRERGRDDL